MKTKTSMRPLKSGRMFTLFAIAVIISLTGCGEKDPERMGGNKPLFGGIKKSTPTEATLSGKTLKITVLDIGQGDSTLIETASGKVILIDAGLPGSQDIIEKVLNDRNIQKIDFVVDSHPHNDHIGGMGKVLTDIPFDTVYDSGLTTGSPAQTRLNNVVTGHIINARAGTNVPIDGDVTMQILQPEDPLFQQGAKSYINNDSVVVKFVFGKTRLLFTGDMEEVERARLYETKADLGADFLKIAHHGSRNGTNAVFLNKVHPQIATISCGNGNSFGHPHVEALQALQATSIALYRTDLSGNITITCDNAGHLQAKPTQIAETGRLYQPGDSRGPKKSRSDSD